MSRYRQPYTLFKRGKYWYYRSYDITGRRTTAHTTGKTSKNAAKSYCDELFLQGKLLGSSKTFEEFATHFFDDNAPYVRDRVEPLSDNTLRAYRKYLKNQLLPIFGKYRLCDISYTVLKQVRAQLLTEYKAGTVVSIYSTMKHIIDSAFRDQIISVNPFTYLEALNAPHETRDAFRIDEVKLLYDKTSDEFKKTVLLMALTGMRISEAVGIQESDIKKAGKCEYIDLKQQFNHKKYTKLKGKNIRVIPIIPEIKELIGFDHLRLSAFYRNFTEIKPLFKDADDRDLAYHSLRHFFMTTIITEGCPEIKAKYTVGHSLKGMNNVYVNFKPDDLIEILPIQKMILDYIMADK